MKVDESITEMALRSCFLGKDISRLFLIDSVFAIITDIHSSLIHLQPDKRLAK